MLKISNSQFEKITQGKYLADDTFNLAILAILKENSQSLHEPYINKIKSLLVNDNQNVQQLSKNLIFVGDDKTPLSFSNIELKDVFLSNSNKEKIKTFLQEYKNKDLLANYNLSIAHHLLFEGKSGMGKTMLAKALANRLALPFFRINMANLINSHVGKTNKNIQMVYQRVAINSGLYLFDEFDSLAAQRSRSNDDSAADKELNNILTEFLKDMEQPISNDSIIIYTTNRKDILDDALLRRFDLTLHFNNFNSLNNEEKEQIFNNYVKEYAKKHKVNNDIFKYNYDFNNYSNLQKLCETELKAYILNKEGK